MSTTIKTRLTGYIYSINGNKIIVISWGRLTRLISSKRLGEGQEVGDQVYD